MPKRLMMVGRFTGIPSWFMGRYYPLQKVFVRALSVNSYDERIHVGFTEWFQLIKKANIVHRCATDEWTENQEIIQVREMTKHDLVTTMDLPVAENEYGEYLHAIKLPVAVPENIDHAATQFLFVRPDDCEIFQCVTARVRNCIVLGNPGISKSWFQWKYILFCARPDLFADLWSKRLIKQVRGSQDEGLEPFSKKTQISLNSFTPQLIVRTVAGKESLLFHVNDTEKVLQLEHSPSDLKKFTDQDSTILWEPGYGQNAVYFSGINARIIATVSPNENMFHQFRKDAKKFYMPCPSEIQIRVMGQICRSFPSNFSIETPSDNEIQQRVKHYGPFIRLALQWTEREIEEFERLRDREIKKICATDNTLQEALLSEHIMEGSRFLPGLSHRLAQYAVEHDFTIDFNGYDRVQYQLSSESVLYEIAKAIDRQKQVDVQAHLMNINNCVIPAEESLSVYLERIFQLHVESGLKWKCFSMRLISDDNASPQTDGQYFHAKLPKIVRKKATLKHLQQGTLYYPSDRSFPLVDLYYKDDSGHLIGIQATVAKQHAKPVSVYEKFYKELETTPQETMLKLYFLILPHQYESYNRGKYPVSKFWTNVGAVGSEWKDNIQFYALLPPDNFEASFPEFESN